jgi:hypothetical protein
MGSTLTAAPAGRHRPAATKVRRSVHTPPARTTATRRVATIAPMAENGATLEEQLEEIRAQLGWVRDYL